jgi:cell division protein FtsB
MTWVHPAFLPARVGDELDLLAQTRQIRAMRERAWIIPLCLLVITSVSVPLRLIEDMPRYLELGAQIARITGSNAQLEREIQALTQETEVLRNDARAIERLARDELGMVRQGEIVFQFQN